MFKWTCLAVAVIALSVFGWMLNDMRLEVKRLATKADDQLPRLLDKTEHVVDQLETHLPKLLNQSETAATNINRHLPPLLKNSEEAAKTLNDQLPRLLASSEAAADGIAQLADDFGDYKAMMSVVHAAKQEKSLFSYGSSILSFIEGQPATIGRKKVGTDQPMTSTVSSKVWANRAKKDVPVLSITSGSKTELLRSLGRSSSVSPWHIQLGKEAPRLLSDWIKETHPESKEAK